MHSHEELKKLKIPNNNNNYKTVYDTIQGIKVFYGYSFINEHDIFENLFTYSYMLDLYDTIKIISSKDDFLSFIRKYKKKTHEIKAYSMLDWDRIKEDFNGLIIINNLKEKIWPKCSDEMTITGIESFQNFIEDLMGTRWKNNNALLSLWLHKWQDNTGIIWNIEGIAKCKLLKITDYSNLIEKICN